MVAHLAQRGVLALRAPAGRGASDSGPSGGADQG